MQVVAQNTNKQSNTKAWFDQMVADIRVDEFLLENDFLEQKKKDIYEAMIKGDHNFMHDYARNQSTVFFIQGIIESYFISLAEHKAKPKRLGLDLSASKVLVWAEIDNDDESTEDALILASAKVNNDFSEYGFHISSTIVEVDDALEIPGHYKEVTINRK